MEDWKVGLVRQILRQPGTHGPFHPPSPTLPSFRYSIPAAAYPCLPPGSLSFTIHIMSFPATARRNRGAYGNPFSGVGVEFAPLAPAPAAPGVLLHEAGYNPRSRDWMFPNVLSPFWRLYFNARPGHRVVMEDGAETRLGPDRIVLIPDGVLFHCRGRASAPHLWLAFQCARRLDASQAVPVALGPRVEERRTIRRLAAEIGAGPRGRRDRIFHLSHAVLHLVLARAEIRWETGGEDDAMARVDAAIAGGLAAALRVADLVKESGLGRRAFLRAFLRKHGTTPARHIVRLRVREAAALLSGTSRSIDDIASATGFPNRHYFTRVFRRLAGSPPAAWRRAHVTTA